VTTSAAADVEAGKTGLGSGKYYVETRNDPDDGWQFRIVNDDGQAVSVKKGASSDYTTGWQAVPTGGGTYDTGRGFSMEFAASGYTSASRGFGAAEISFIAKGAVIDIEASNSLVDIASKVNAAKYTEGNEVIATIVDNQLILSGKYSGDNRNIQVSDVSGSILADLEVYNGSTFLHQMQNSLSANFKVNGLDVKRSQNTGLTDVIHGVTLNLDKDSAGKTAVLNVTASTDSNKKQISGFVGEFNKLTKYLTDKIATTKKADDTYTRGALAGDMVFSSLRYDLLRLPSAGYSNSGNLSRLRDIGITMDKDLKRGFSAGCGHDPDEYES
jgi:flagellar hook-associated protein 2